MGNTATKMFDFMNSPLFELSTVDFGIQFSVFIVSAFLKTEKFYDLTGSLTFIVLSHLCTKWIPERSLRQQIQSGMILTWAVRLGTFLFIRVLKSGKDRRFDKCRDNPKLFFVYWTMQVCSSIVREFLELFYNLWRTVLAKNKIVLDSALRLQSFRIPENATIGVRSGIECQQQERWRPSSRLF
ncbi:uncharacterized protein TNCV_4223131 [Trichonephila clavipes]|nr:uncharacterized protein TNCV_4223131 [Trichonephila clavipes]